MTKRHDKKKEEKTQRWTKVEKEHKHAFQGALYERKEKRSDSTCLCFCQPSTLKPLRQCRNDRHAIGPVPQYRSFACDADVERGGTEF